MLLGVIGDRIRLHRRNRKLAQADLAAALGPRYNHSVISRVERGQANLLLDGAIRAAMELNVSLDYLTGLIDNPTPAETLDSYLVQYTIGPPISAEEGAAMLISRLLTENRLETWIAAGEER